MIGSALGRYRILERIGAGGMGVVFLARDERLEREVAVKVLPAGTLADEAARRRFRKEAQVLSKLNHANIATVYDFDTQDGVDFLVMEYVPGETLDAKIVQGGIAEDEVRRLGIQLAQGLAAAHDKHVVHRDLKPGNLRVTPDGQLKILDFGLARLWQPVSETSTTLSPSQVTKSFTTDTEGVVGTVPYMSPEQLSAAKVDTRSDLYSAGVVLYEMATGRRPFTDTQVPQLVAAILSQAPPAPSSVNHTISNELESIVLRAVEKDPDRRYQSASELRTDLERLGTSASLLATRPRRRSRRRITLIGVASAVPLLILALDPGGYRNRFLGRSPRIKSLAVLPIENLSGDPNQDYFADGVTGELISELAKISTLRVISRTSAMQYKGNRKPLAQIARELKVDAIVEGTVQQAGGRARISAQLIEVAKDRHLWSESYERELQDILALQDDVVRAISDAIRIRLTAEERRQFQKARRVDPEAHGAYLRGRYYVDRMTFEEVKRGLQYFNQAISIDPTYAQAYAGLASGYLWASGTFMSPEEVMPKARAAAMRAIEIDSTFAEAHMVLGYVRSFYEWNWVEGERSLRRAIELGPGDAMAHWAYGIYLAPNSRFDESIAEFERARELDPLSLVIGATSLYPLYEGRRYDEAIAAAQKFIASVDSTSWAYENAHQVLGQAYLQKKEYAKAIAALRTASKPQGGTENAFPLALLGSAYAASQQTHEALAILQQLEAQPSAMQMQAYAVGILYTALGDRHQALEWLEKSVDQRTDNAAWLKVDPQLDDLRSDPRFAILLGRVGFPIE